MLASAVYLLLSDGEPAAGTAAGRLDPAAVAVLLGFLGLLGLRDKVAFLAARPEVYGPLLIVFLFPLTNLIVGAQIVFLCIWLGAASSKLNRHFPFVVSVMISNTPWNRSRKAKALLYTELPRGPAARLAGGGSRPTSARRSSSRCRSLLFLSSGGVIGTIAVIGMIIFHVHITSTFPLAVPLEWNLFMIFGILFLFGHYGDVPLSTLDSPLLLAILLVICVGIPVLGNFRPDQVSFLPAMRYYAGNWATSQWLFSKASGAEEKLDRSINKPAPIVVEQLTTLYGRETRRVPAQQGARVPRHALARPGAQRAAAACAGGDVEAYDVREGELISGVVNGWNFGDGHLHNEQLLDAVQERCALRARRAADRDARVPARAHPAPALPDLRRRDRPARGGLGRTSPTWSRAGPGSRSRGTSRSR